MSFVRLALLLLAFACPQLFASWGIFDAPECAARLVQLAELLNESDPPDGVTAYDQDRWVSNAARVTYLEMVARREHRDLQFVRWLDEALYHGPLTQFADQAALVGTRGYHDAGDGFSNYLTHRLREVFELTGNVGDLLERLPIGSNLVGHPELLLYDPEARETLARRQLVLAAMSSLRHGVFQRLSQLDPLSPFDEFPLSEIQDAVDFEKDELQRRFRANGFELGMNWRAHAEDLESVEIKKADFFQGYTTRIQFDRGRQAVGFRDFLEYSGVPLFELQREELYYLLIDSRAD